MINSDGFKGCLRDFVITIELCFTLLLQLYFKF